jgi:hypothetical protein
MIYLVAAYGHVLLNICQLLKFIMVCFVANGLCSVGLLNRGSIVVAGGSNYYIQKVECPGPNHQLLSILVQAKGYPQMLVQLCFG